MQIKTFEIKVEKDGIEILKSIENNKSDKENYIQFSLLDYTTTIDIENQTFSRENDEFLFFLDIKNKNCTIHLKQEQMNCNILVDECIFKIDKTKIIIEYVIESEDARNRITITNKGDENE